MKKIAMLACLFTSGCSFLQVTAPVSDTANNDLKELEPPKVETIPLPKLPEAKIVKTEKGEEAVTFNDKGFEELRKFKEAARTNTALADKLIETNKLSVDYANSAVRVAKLEEKRANMWAKQWAATEQQRREEKLEHEWDLMFYRVLLILGAVYGL